MTSVSVAFVVNTTTTNEEVVYIVGNDPSLGSWCPLKAVPLQNVNGNQWSCIVNLRCDSSYSYRYFVGRTQPKRLTEYNGLPLQNIDVIRWETHQQPHHFTTGQDGELSLPVTEFGIIDGVNSMGKGWLIDRFEIHIRLHGDPICLLNNCLKGKALSIKCQPVEYSLVQDVDSIVTLGDTSDVMVSKLIAKECHPSPQGPSGVAFNKDDFIIYRYRTRELQELGFQLDVFACEEDNNTVLIGSAHLHPHNHPDSQHKIHLPIIGLQGRPIGTVSVDILVARPAHGITFDMEHCNQGYWDWRKLDQKPLDIGHRGMGPSYSVENCYKENTVASFNAAFQHGADFIETDVLLSKDHYPVIFHDFAVTTALQNKRDAESVDVFHDVLVQDLTLSQLQSMKFFTSHGKGINDEEVPMELMDPFPTLAQILTDVDERLGYNLEFKYPQMDVLDVHEAKNFRDMNNYLDTILKTLFEYANHRRIVFSTFQPDICVLLSLKQNRFPVMFLSQGKSKMYTWYKDYRATTFDNALNFAISEQILGLVLHTEMLLEDLDVIKRVIEDQSLLFVWGMHNNDVEVISQMRQCKVDGIIYDRMDINKPENASKISSNGGIPNKSESDASPKKKAKCED